MRGQVRGNDDVIGLLVSYTITTTIVELSPFLKPRATIFSPEQTG
jgi:hypothetical protein